MIVLSPLRFVGGVKRFVFDPHLTTDPSDLRAKKQSRPPATFIAFVRPDGGGYEGEEFCTKTVPPERTKAKGPPDIGLAILTAMSFETP